MPKDISQIVGIKDEGAKIIGIIPEETNKLYDARYIGDELVPVDNQPSNIKVHKIVWASDDTGTTNQASSLFVRQILQAVVGTSPALSSYPNLN